MPIQTKQKGKRNKWTKPEYSFLSVMMMVLGVALANLFYDLDLRFIEIIFRVIYLLGLIGIGTKKD